MPQYGGITPYVNISFVAAEFFRRKARSEGVAEGCVWGGFRRARVLGWETARPCVSKETKPVKIDSLIEKDFCARPLKDLSIFAGFVRRQAASRKISGRRSAPPTNSSVKNQKVKF
jgi:hypothetical protein